MFLPSGVPLVGARPGKRPAGRIGFLDAVVSRAQCPHKFLRVRLVVPFTGQVRLVPQFDVMQSSPEPGNKTANQVFISGVMAVGARFRLAREVGGIGPVGGRKVMQSGDDVQASKARSVDKSGPLAVERPLGSVLYVHQLLHPAAAPAQFGGQVKLADGFTVVLNHRVNTECVGPGRFGAG